MSYLWKRNTSKAEAGWKPRAVGCEPQEHMCLVWDNVAKVGGSDCYIWSSKKRGRTEKKPLRWAWFKDLEFIRIPLCVEGKKEKKSTYPPLLSQIKPVPGWTPFAFRYCINSLWHWFNKVLETFLRDFVPDWHDSITQWPWTCPNGQSDHIPKGPGDCEDHWSTTNSCSRKPFEMIRALWHGPLSCWKRPSEDAYTVIIKGWAWSATTLRKAMVFKWCSLTHGQNGSRLSCCLLQVLTLWKLAEIQNGQTRECFSNLLLSSQGL